MSQPWMRPERCAFCPEMYSVQSLLLSAFQRPAAFLLTMWLTGAGIGGNWSVGMSGFIGGSNKSPLLGGGFCPPYGPDGSPTGPGSGRTPKGVNGGARMVDALPDSKMAT